MGYHISISIRLKTRAETQPILDALEPVGIYPDEDDITRKGVLAMWITWPGTFPTPKIG